MNKYGKLAMSFLLVFLAIFALTGCSATDGLWRLEREFKLNIQTGDTLDDVADTDLAEGSLDDLSTLIDTGCVALLSESLELTPAQKIAEIEILHEAITSTHLSIVETRNSNKITFQSFKSSVADFRENDFSLSSDDKEQVQLWISELKELKLTLQDTIGKAFAQMRSLRGNYNLDNLDLILSTYQEVDEVLKTRLEAMMRIGEILGLAHDMIGAYGE